MADLKWSSEGAQKREVYFLRHESRKYKKTPDKRRRYNDAFKAADQQSDISPKLLYRWQEAKLVAEVGSVEVGRDLEVHQLRAQLRRAEQELDMLKKPCSSLASRPSEHLPLQRPTSGSYIRAPALPGAARGPERLVCLAAPATARAGISLASSCGS